ncbi:MAG: ABC transporter ATP-binding protein [Rubrobacteridae bacterium]|nr:ABC transporter ATP-binding protein [Rubrobacteridae bacterium]
MALLEMNDISKYYGNNQSARVTALDNINFTIDAGEYVAVMGPSGSGKSTLLTILGAMNSPNLGKLMIDEIDVYSLSQQKIADFRREYLGFVFQQLQLIPYLTAIENVMLPLLITGRKDKKEAAIDILEQVGLGKKINRLPSELSGGEQSRVAVARAIVNKPPILLADEPVGSLDTHTGQEVLSLLKRLHSEGQTIIMVTHNPESIRDATRLISLRDGCIESSTILQQRLPSC